MNIYQAIAQFIDHGFKMRTDESGFSMAKHIEAYNGDYFFLWVDYLPHADADHFRVCICKRRFGSKPFQFTVPVTEDFGKLINSDDFAGKIGLCEETYELLKKTYDPKQKNLAEDAY